MKYGITYRVSDVIFSSFILEAPDEETVKQYMMENKRSIEEPTISQISDREADSLVKKGMSLVQIGGEYFGR